MEADLFDQRRLLELQAVDTTLTQLDQRRRRLDDDQAIPTARRDLQVLRDRAASLKADIADADRDIKRIEQEVELVTKRAEADRRRMASGSAPPKELEGLQSELESLARRQSSLEDDELEFMERREGLETELNESERRTEESEAALADAEADRDRRLGELHSETESAASERNRLTGSIPPRLVELYESIHARQPIAAAELVGRRCGSCRIEKSPADMAPIRAAAINEVLRCEECGAILIRTDVGPGADTEVVSDEELDKYTR
ncbi:zinc ribbon domain-containing protein [Glycomyces xiaoerkulensis]|uniref:zinc ribbon domain-containing protein n=1 Tax=Glycomyces xiaoerkulensis TaxID=2038139 RepID=UPI000C26B9C2|nr:C4-type zinc ribbon domain-containing protein [Glycomyces xiaoerkulensis]